MRILHLAKYYWPRSGGMERVVQGLAEGAAALGHQVEVVAVESRGWAGRPGRQRSSVTRALLLRGARLPGDRARVHRGGLEAGRHHPRASSPSAGRRRLPAPGPPHAGRGDPARRQPARDVPPRRPGWCCGGPRRSWCRAGPTSRSPPSCRATKQGRGHPLRDRSDPVGGRAAPAAGCGAPRDLHRPAGGLQGPRRPAARAGAGARPPARRGRRGPGRAAAPDAGPGARRARPGALVRRVSGRGPSPPHGRRRLPGAAVGDDRGDVRPGGARGDGRGSSGDHHGASERGAGGERART